MNLLKIAVRKIFYWLGYRIITAPPNKGTNYEPVFPGATYNPWNKDARFKEVFEGVRPYTLVDRYRCFELWRLVEQSSAFRVAQNHPGNVGVFEHAHRHLSRKRTTRLVVRILCGNSHLGPFKLLLNRKQVHGRRRDHHLYPCPNPISA